MDSGGGLFCLLTNKTIITIISIISSHFTDEYNLECLLNAALRFARANGTLICPILQMSKLRHGGVGALAQA